MRVLFVGSVILSEVLLLELLRADVNVVGVCTKEKPGINADFRDLGYLGGNYNIKTLKTADINASESVNWIRDLEPDIIFCAGWSQIFGRDVLRIPRKGVVGFHPSDLPKNRGRHPIIWPLVLGLTETASTFFLMDEGVDSGDIVSQRKIKIEDSDDAGTLYEKISQVASVQVKEIYKELLTNSLVRIKQNHELSNTWRRRSKIDGLIDWRMSARSIHNLVRGLAKPYVGAHFLSDGQEIRVWKTEVVDEGELNVEPGKVIDSTSRVLTIKCGEGAIALTNFEPDSWQPKGEYV